MRDCREVPDYPNYRACSDGSVWAKGINSRNTLQEGEWHLTVGSLDKDGYRRVALGPASARKSFRVNQLILKTFVGDPPQGMRNPTAAHLNGKLTDNRLENLQWKTQKENIADKERHGTSQIGERHPLHKLTEEAVIDIRESRKRGVMLKELAMRYGVDKAAICAAAKGRTWKHVNDV